MSQTQERIHARGLVVFDGGRVTLPSAARKKYEEMTGDEVGFFHTFELLEDDDNGDVFDARVDGDYQFYIPARFRNRYDIDDGDYVDLDLLVGGGE